MDMVESIDAFRGTDRDSNGAGPFLTVTPVVSEGVIAREDSLRPAMVDGPEALRFWRKVPSFGVVKGVPWTESVLSCRKDPLLFPERSVAKDSFNLSRGDLFGSLARPGLYRGDRGEYEGELAAFGERGNPRTCGLVCIKPSVRGVAV